MFPVSDSELRLIRYCTWLLDSFAILHSSVLKISIDVFRFVDGILRISVFTRPISRGRFADCALRIMFFQNTDFCLPLGRYRFSDIGLRIAIGRYPFTNAQ